MGTESLRQVGSSIRHGREARGWLQAELAARAGVSQSAVSDAEAGRGARIDTLQRLCRSLGGDLVIEARLLFAGEARRQVDLGHARCVGRMCRILEAAGHVCATEEPVAEGSWRGWIDLVAYDAERRRLTLVEVKTELRDVGALERQVERYVAGCLHLARRRAWSVREIAVAVIVLATSANDAFLLANRQALGASFPVRGRRAVASLVGGDPVRGRMLLMLDPLRRGRRGLVRSSADGRRTPAPFQDYRQFIATIEAGRDPRRLPSSGAGPERHPARHIAPRGTPDA
jgi:transcriptional regulator with XRE-family HTH domain